MSQVDYLHFFNNVIWNLIQLLIMYFFVCTVYVQIFYKVFRLRLLNYTFLIDVLKKQDNYLNNFLDLLKEDGIFFFNVVKPYKMVDNININQKLIKCFYE